MHLASGYARRAHVLAAVTAAAGVSACADTATPTALAARTIQAPSFATSTAPSTVGAPAKIFLVSWGTQLPKGAREKVTAVVVDSSGRVIPSVGLIWSASPASVLQI